jgi:hypothetical protein
MTMRAGEVYEHPYERLVVRVGTAESDGRELIADLYVRADVKGRYEESLTRGPNEIVEPEPLPVEPTPEQLGR